MNGSPLARAMSWPAPLGALAFIFLSASPVCAAVITWGNPTNIFKDTDVSTEGSLLEAYSFGRRSLPETEPEIMVAGATVNGVVFAPFGVPTQSTATVTVGGVTLGVGPISQEFQSENETTGSGVSPFKYLSPSYQTLLKSQVSSDDNQSTLTLMLGGLTTGQEYLVQFWSNDSGAFLNRLGGTVYTAGNSVTLDNSIENDLGGVGQWVIGRFTADHFEQVITIESSTPPGDFPVINAMQLRLVPEPSSALLWASGVVLCLRRRRTAA